MTRDALQGVIEWVAQQHGPLCGPRACMCGAEDVAGTLRELRRSLVYVARRDGESVEAASPGNLGGRAHTRWDGRRPEAVVAAYERELNQDEAWEFDQGFTE